MQHGLCYDCLNLSELLCIGATSRRCMLLERMSQQGFRAMQCKQDQAKQADDDERALYLGQHHIVRNPLSRGKRQFLPAVLIGCKGRSSSWAVMLRIRRAAAYALAGHLSLSDRWTSSERNRVDGVRRWHTKVAKAHRWAMKQQGLCHDPALVPPRKPCSSSLQHCMHYRRRLGSRRMKRCRRLSVISVGAIPG